MHLERAALTYIAKNGHKYNLDTSKIAVAGDSVGGNISIAMTLLAKKNKIRIKRQALFYPVIDAKMNTELSTIFKWSMANKKSNGVVLGCLCI